MRWQIPLCRRLQYQVRWPYQQQQGNAQWIREIVMSWHMVPPDRGESVVRYLQLRCMAAEYLFLFPPCGFGLLASFNPFGNTCWVMLPCTFIDFVGCANTIKGKEVRKRKRKRHCFDVGLSFDCMVLTIMKKIEKKKYKCKNLQLYCNSQCFHFYFIFFEPLNFSLSCNIHSLHIVMAIIM